MDYHYLSPEDMANIQHRKLREIETEHAAIDLELRLAAIAGIDNDRTAIAAAHRDILDVQHAALLAIIYPHQPEPVTVVADVNEDETACLDS